MRGTHRIVVQNKRIRYDFEIRRNLTIIRGDSATGKTTLVDMIREYYENGNASGVQLRCDKECQILSGKKWAAELAEMKDSIIFIDEGNEFVFTDDFASIIQNTDNYYVIVTRERIPSLPYSVEEIYGIRDSGKYGTSKRTYNEFFHLYQLEDYQTVVKPEIIITEDSNSGYQFFKAAAGKSCFLVLQFILSIPCTYLLRSAGAAIPEYDITFASAKIMKVLKGFLWSCCDGVWSNEVLQ